MLQKLKKKSLLFVGTIITSLLGVYVGNSFSKQDSPLIDIDKAFADIPADIPVDLGGGGDSSGGGADCSGY